MRPVAFTRFACPLNPVTVIVNELKLASKAHEPEAGYLANRMTR
jgi:hypothetical protein